MHDFKVQKTEEYGATFKITVSTEIGDTTYTERFGFSARQYENGDWKSHIYEWIEELKAEQALESTDLSELEGEEFVVESKDSGVEMNKK